MRWGRTESQIEVGIHAEGIGVEDRPAAESRPKFPGSQECHAAFTELEFRPGFA